MFLKFLRRCFPFIDVSEYLAHDLVIASQDSDSSVNLLSIYYGFSSLSWMIGSNQFHVFPLKYPLTNSTLASSPS
jgi:hypothetical protein